MVTATGIVLYGKDKPAEDMLKVSAQGNTTGNSNQLTSTDKFEGDDMEEIEKTSSCGLGSPPGLSAATEGRSALLRLLPAALRQCDLTPAAVMHSIDGNGVDYVCTILDQLAADGMTIPDTPEGCAELEWALLDGLQGLIDGGAGERTRLSTVACVLPSACTTEMW